MNDSDKSAPRLHIVATPKYLDEQSEPQEQRYVFAYTIEIENVGEVPCQLLNRHWIITDGTGEVEEVRGEGVVGQQPHLVAGQKFEYTSGAILKTPVGTMHGEFEFTDDAGARFEVPIPVFSLRVPNLIH